jgi:hypothetical protein
MGALFESVRSFGQRLDQGVEEGFAEVASWMRQAGPDLGEGLRVGELDVYEKLIWAGRRGLIDKAFLRV